LELVLSGKFEPFGEVRKGTGVPIEEYGGSLELEFVILPNFKKIQNRKS
jgi:hypothetical protein